MIDLHVLSLFLVVELYKVSPWDLSPFLVINSPKRGLDPRGLLMIDLHVLSLFLVVELYKGCWQLKRPQKAF